MILLKYEPDYITSLFRIPLTQCSQEAVPCKAPVGYFSALPYDTPVQHPSSISPLQLCSLSSLLLEPFLGPVCQEGSSSRYLIGSSVLVALCSNISHQCGLPSLKLQPPLPSFLLNFFSSSLDNILYISTYLSYLYFSSIKI